MPIFCYNLKIILNTKTKMIPKIEKPNTSAQEILNPLAEAAREMQESIREPITCETSFQDNPERNISDLAKAAYRDIPQEQERYNAKIKASLEAHLEQGQNIQSLWAYLKEKGCRTAVIVNGFLRFFAGPNGENEIQIEKFAKPFRLEAESILKKTLIKKRTEVMGSSHMQMASFLSELQAENPDVPNLPTKTTV
jgi:hypothetical protein